MEDEQLYIEVCTLLSAHRVFESYDLDLPVLSTLSLLSDEDQAITIELYSPSDDALWQASKYFRLKQEVNKYVEGCSRNPEILPRVNPLITPTIVEVLLHYLYLKGARGLDSIQEALCDSVSNEFSDNLGVLQEEIYLFARIFTYNSLGRKSKRIISLIKDVVKKDKKLFQFFNPVMLYTPGFFLDELTHVENQNKELGYFVQYFKKVWPTKGDQRINELSSVFSLTPEGISCILDSPKFSKPPRLLFKGELEPRVLNYIMNVIKAFSRNGKLTAKRVHKISYGFGIAPESVSYLLGIVSGKDCKINRVMKEVVSPREENKECTVGRTFDPFIGDQIILTMRLFRDWARREINIGILKDLYPTMPDNHLSTLLELHQGADPSEYNCVASKFFKTYNKKVHDGLSKRVYKKRVELERIRLAFKIIYYGLHDENDSSGEPLLLSGRCVGKLSKFKQGLQEIIHITDSPFGYLLRVWNGGTPYDTDKGRVEKIKKLLEEDKGHPYLKTFQGFSTGQAITRESVLKGDVFEVLNVFSLFSPSLQGSPKEYLDVLRSLGCTIKTATLSSILGTYRGTYSTSNRMAEAYLSGEVLLPRKLTPEILGRMRKFISWYDKNRGEGLLSANHALTLKFLADTFIVDEGELLEKRSFLKDSSLDDIKAPMEEDECTDESPLVPQEAKPIESDDEYELFYKLFKDCLGEEIPEVLISKEAQELSPELSAKMWESVKSDFHKKFLLPYLEEFKRTLREGYALKLKGN